MYIEPNTNIKILKNVPLSNNYKHTLYFESASSQASYFASLVKYNFTGQSYQRVQKGKSRIEVQAENLYDCNYMMFQNSSFGNKWFYAFITSVEYVNNAVSEITFEIDVLQTWFFNFLLRPSYVEREHSETDVIGENLVPEPVDLGNIICSAMSGTGKFDSYVAVIATAYDPDGQAGGCVGGLFSGLNYVAGLVDDEDDVQMLLDFLEACVDANKSESIVSIFLMPTDFYTSGDMPVVETSEVAKPTKLDGYAPRNKKLLTAPYCFLGVDCGDNSAVYKYEFFDSARCQFTFNSCVTPNPEIQLVPVDYNGGDFNYVEKLVMRGFPQLGFSIDSFRAWVAQGGDVSSALKMLGSGVAVGASIATGNAVTGAMGAVGMANTVNDIMIAAHRPPQAVGCNGSSVAVATRTKDFYFRQMSVTNEYANMIDGFFDIYGYATCRKKIPNTHSRPHWNYVKTKDCTITGSVPADDMKKICSIHDAGVTYWKRGSEVGNYLLNNSV